LWAPVLVVEVAVEAAAAVLVSTLNFLTFI